MFTKVAAAGGFTDPRLPAGYAPFGIQAIDGSLYVTSAKQDTAAHDNINGAGLGIVDVFDATGHFVKRLITLAEGRSYDRDHVALIFDANDGPQRGSLALITGIAYSRPIAAHARK